MRQLLDFEPENMKALHFFTQNLNFPVAVATYGDWEEQQLSYLEYNFHSGRYTTTSLCQWCVNHHIQYRIIYPLSFKSIIKNPRKYIDFLRLKRKLHYSL